MTAVHSDLGFTPGLVEWLDDHAIKYEVIDGMLVVSPPPTMTHERLVVRIFRALDAAAVPGTEVLVSGVKSFYVGDFHVYADVNVVRTADADLDDEGMRVPPLLVVEVLSPSTRRKDLLLKREIYAEFGIPSYWLVDPKTRTLTVLSLRDGAYVETARGARLELTEPFPVVVDLA